MRHTAAKHFSFAQLWRTAGAKILQVSCNRDSPGLCLSLLRFLSGVHGSNKSDLTQTTCYKMCSVIHNEIYRLLCHILSWKTLIFLYINFNLKAEDKCRSVCDVWYWHFRKLYRAWLSEACYSKPSSALPCVSNSNQSTGHKPDITNPLQTLRLLLKRSTSTSGKC